MKIKRKTTALMTAGIISIELLFAGTSVLANDLYPTTDSTTDANKITMTNTASWADALHQDGDYRANLDISINGLTDTKTFNEPIDVQIVHDISTSMDEMCWTPGHVNFHYYHRLKNAVTEEQLVDYKNLIEETLMDLIQNGSGFTGKDDWISIAGKEDKDGNVFSDDAYLVPNCSFAPIYGDEPWPSNYEEWFSIIDNPVLSMDDEGLGSGHAFYGYEEKYHASIDEDGSYHSLSIVPDPTSAEFVNFGYFDNATAIWQGCKSYTTTAYHLLSDFGNELYSANQDNHLSMNSFAEDNRYVSSYADNIDDFNTNLITAFNQLGGQTNYEAGLINGRDSLYAHSDGDERKQYLIFISDGNPNRAFDDEGNIVKSSDMSRLVDISAKIKERGIEIYTVGFCIDKYTNDTYLLPMATDEEHSQFRTPDQLDQMVEIYDLMKEQIIKDTYIKSTVDNTISQYYTVDKDTLPEEISLIESEETSEDGSTVLVQKIRYNVRTEDLDEDGINTKTIPLILKEEYWDTNAYYPTNDEDREGANAVYEDLDGARQNIAVKTPWLPVNADTKETYTIDTEVVNGSISERMTEIGPGENRVVEYTPNEGCELKEIYVDNLLVDIAGVELKYTFDNIAADHLIKVVYEKQEQGNTEVPDTPEQGGNISQGTGNNGANDNGTLDKVTGNKENAVKSSSPSKKISSVKTGDETPVVILAVVCMLAGGGIILAVYKRRHH